MTRHSCFQLTIAHPSEELSVFMSRPVSPVHHVMLVSRVLLFVFGIGEVFEARRVTKKYTD